MPSLSFISNIGVPAGRTSFTQRSHLHRDGTRLCLNATSHRRQSPRVRCTAYDGSPPPAVSPPETSAAPPSPSDQPFTWMDKWYPVAWAEDVVDDQMYKFNLFDRAYILVRDKKTRTFTAMEDICPHRAAPLSEGRLFTNASETMIECRYHGWRFSACSGLCTNIPILSDTPPTRAAVRNVYITKESNFGLIFVFLSLSSPADIKQSELPDFPMPERLARIHADPSQSEKAFMYRSSSREFPFPIDILLENLADPSHVPWSHHLTDGDRRKVSPTSGSDGINLYSAHPSTGLFRAMFNLVGSTLHLDIQPPLVTYYGLGKKEDNSDARFFLIFWCVPCGRSRSKIYAIRAFINATFVFKMKSFLKPTWMQHAHSNSILDGDSPLLQMVYRLLVQRGLESNGKPGWQSSYLLSETKWDTVVIAIRQWFDKTAKEIPYASWGDINEVPPLMSVQQVNDRLKWHTSGCRKCSLALKRLTMVELVSRWLLPVVGSIVAVLSLVDASRAGKRIVIGGRFGISSLFLWMALVIVMVASRRGIACLTYTDRAAILHKRDDTLF